VTGESGGHCLPVVFDRENHASSSTHAGESERSGSSRDALHGELAGLSYAEGAARLSPQPIQMSQSPTVSETATTKLTELEGSEHETTDLCYMENSTKALLILKAHKTALQAVETPDTDGSRTEEIARVSRMVGYLEYSLKITGAEGRNKSITQAEAAQAAFPDLDAKAALVEARKLYHIASTQPGKIRRTPTPLRGIGVGGALAAMGGAEVLYQDEILAGKLTPGAPLQMWWAESEMYLRGKDEPVSMTGKEVYQAISAGKVDPANGIMGHSITFVKYDEADPNVIHYMEQYDNSVETADVRGDDTYYLGANLSTSGEASNAAEYVLMSTGFKADIGKDYIVKQAARHDLDAGKLAASLIAGINGSGHENLAAIQASVAHHGTPSAFDHNMARLIGLWQHAVGITVDGVFGNGSCNTLTGTSLSEATSLKLA